MGVEEPVSVYKRLIDDLVHNSRSITAQLILESNIYSKPGDGKKVYGN